MLTPIPNYPSAPAALRRRWWLVASGFGLAWLMAWLLLRQAVAGAYAIQWLLAAGIVLAFELWLLCRYLAANVVAGHRAALPGLGPGNLLTLARGLLVGLLAGFLPMPRRPDGLGWLPVALFTAAALLDLVDGYAARRAGTATELGAILDVEFDALAVFLVAALAVRLGNLPPWFLILGAARYLFMAGQWWRARRGRPNAPLQPSRYRRVVAGCFMAFLTVMIWPIVRPPGSYVAAAVFTLPYAAIFLRDWLVVSGRVDPGSPAYRRRWTRVAGRMTRWLPVACRLSVGALVGLALAQGRSPDWPGFFALAGVPLPAEAVRWFDGLAVCAALLVVAGILTHFSAVLLILTAAADVLPGTLGPSNALLLAAACCLVLLGGGSFVLWEPESRGIYRRRLGERQVEGI